MWLLLFTTTLLAANPAAAPAPPRVEAWAGHQVLRGKRKVPIYGLQDTHTEDFLIAEIHRSEGRIEVIQKLCRTEVKPVKGVTAGMKQETVLRLPRTRVSFAVRADGSLAAPPWSTGWGSEDVDGDGFPGATVHIAGKCDGQVYVSNHATTTLVSGRATEDGMAGNIDVLVKQKVLGASGFCLKLVAGDSDERQIGNFAFRRVPIGSSCSSLAGKPWPVQASPPPPAKPKN
jgi:hypothetical protein